MGVFRLAVDTPITLGLSAGYAQGSLLWIVNNIYFQYYSLLIFVVTLIVMIVVSYMTEKPDYSRISGLTYATATAEDKAVTRASWSAIDVVTSALVLVAILAAYLYFRG
jgi:SSS family solute:Na+ symporter